MNAPSTGPATRSPIKNPVKRQAGQTLADDLDSLLGEESFLCVFPLGISLFWLLIEILNRVFKTSTPLWLLVAFVVLATVHCVVRFRKMKQRAKLLRQGLDGERYVAQIIEKDLIPAGYRVIHDLVMESGEKRFNVDHLLIGGNGVFCLETKAWSKPERGETIATYDGSKILLNGADRCGDAVDQARALSKEVHERIKQQTGISVKVTPFIVCVGWYVQRTVAGIPDVQVVNEKALAAFITRCSGALSPTDVNVISQRMTEAFT